METIVKSHQNIIAFKYIIGYKSISIPIYNK